MGASLFALIASLAVSAAVVRLLRRGASRLPHASPDGRGLHEGRVPRAGGLAIWAGLGVLAVAPGPMPVGWPESLGGALLVGAISLADDFRGVPVAARLSVQLVAAAVVAYSLFGDAIAIVPIIVGTLVIAWGCNLFNFMDGSDGLAATMGVAGFGSFSIAAAIAGAPWLASAVVVCACIPFLIVNRPPAAMFMGDVGSVPLGFLAASAGLAGVAASTWPAWFPLLVFLPFVGDATVTLLVRALRGERVWRPHREHYYQRLNRLGAGHRGTLAVYAAAMLGCGATALICLAFAPGHGSLALGVAGVAHLIGFLAIDYHWRNRRLRDKQ